MHALPFFHLLPAVVPLRQQSVVFLTEVLTVWLGAAHRSSLLNQWCEQTRMLEVTLMRKLCRDFQRSTQVIDLLMIPSFFPVTLPWSCRTPGVWWSPLPQPWPPSPFLCEWFSPHATYSSDLNLVNLFLMLQSADDLLQVSELPPTNSLNKMTWAN